MKDLRKHINLVANQHKEVVDNDSLWEGIQEKMDKPKKRRPIFPLFIWGISFLIISVLVINLNNLFEKNILSPSNTGHDSFTTAKDINSSNTLSSSKIKTTNPDQSKNIKDNNVESGEVKKVVAIKKSIDKKSIDKKSKNTIVSNQMKGSNINARNVTPSAVRFPTNQKNLDKEITAFNDNKIQAQHLKRNELANPFTLGSSLNNVSFERSKIRINLEVENSTPQPQFFNDNEGFSFFNSLTFYTQYGNGSKSILGNSDYAQLRNQSEELMEQIRLGIEFDLIKFLDFTIYGGLSYASINDRVTRVGSYYENKEITYVKSIIISPDGSKIEKLVTEDLPHFVTHQATRYNSHKIISAPIGLKFGKTFSKLNLGVGFGLDFNYYLTDTHTVLGADNEMTSIDVGGRWLSPSLHTSINMEYPISEKWFLQSKFIYRNTSIDNVTVVNNFNQNYKIYGIDLGLKFEF